MLNNFECLFCTRSKNQNQKRTSRYWIKISQVSSQYPNITLILLNLRINLDETTRWVGLETIRFKSREYISCHTFNAMAFLWSWMDTWSYLYRIVPRSSASSRNGTAVVCITPHRFLCCLCPNWHGSKLTRAWRVLVGSSVWGLMGPPVFYIKPNGSQIYLYRDELDQNCLLEVYWTNSCWFRGLRICLARVCAIRLSGVRLSVFRSWIRLCLWCVS